MNINTGHNLNDIVYYVKNTYYGNQNRDVTKGKIIRIELGSKGIEYTISNLEEDKYPDTRLECDVFKTPDEAQLKRISIILDKYSIKMDDVIKLISNLDLWKSVKEVS